MTESVLDHSAQTSCSDPGRYSGLLDPIAPEIAAISAAARNLIVHYRSSGRELPEYSRDDIQLRWVAAQLAVDQGRHHRALSEERAPEDRVQGCCRDHALFSVAVLRHHGVPARTRIGFTTYFSPTWHHDHVITEMWSEGRWRRFDPEVAAPLSALPDPTDIGRGMNSPFLTAAEVWTGHRRGELDVNRFGVLEDLGIDGDWFVHGYVIREVAHRFGDELLLWDEWGAMYDDLAEAPSDELALIDEVADLLIRSDEGDLGAEGELLARYRADDRLRPSEVIQTRPPTGAGRSDVNLSNAATG